MPKLKNEFEQNLYSAFQQCGFDVHLGRHEDSREEVTYADARVLGDKAVAFGPLTEDQATVSFGGLAGNADTKEVLVDRREEPVLVVGRADSLSAMILKIRKAMADLIPELQVSVPENTRDIGDIPTTSPKIDERNKIKQKDDILEQIFALSKDAPEEERQRLYQRLRMLGSLLLKCGGTEAEWESEREDWYKVGLHEVFGSYPQYKQPNIEVAVGDRVLIATDLDLVDTVYFAEGFHCGASLCTDAVDLGKYKIAVKKGVFATVNSVQGSTVHLIELSDLGVISAFDPIKHREISNSVQVHSCSTSISNLQKVG